MKLAKKDITLLTTGTALALVGLAVVAIFIFADKNTYLFLGASIGNAFVAMATFTLVWFGLCRYDNSKKANKIAIWLSLGIAVATLFLIPFGKIMIERENGLVIWAVALSALFAIVGGMICLVSGIYWKQEIVDLKRNN